MFLGVIYKNYNSYDMNQLYLKKYLILQYNLKNSQTTLRQILFGKVPGNETYISGTRRKFTIVVNLLEDLSFDVTELGLAVHSCTA